MRLSEFELATDKLYIKTTSTKYFLEPDQFLLDKFSNFSDFSQKIYWRDRENNEFLIIGFLIDQSADYTERANIDEFREAFFFANPGLDIFEAGSFNDTGNTSNWEGYGYYRIIVPHFILHQKPKDRQVIIKEYQSDYYSKETKLNKEKVIASLRKSKAPEINTFLDIDSRKDIPDQKTWEEQILQITNKIKSGALSKAVLSRQTTFSITNSSGVYSLFRFMVNANPNSYSYFFQQKTDHIFLGVSPERLCKIVGNKILTEALAGSIHRDKDSVINTGLKNSLLNDQKNIEEHKWVKVYVDEVLNEVCQRFTWNLSPEIKSQYSIHHLQQEAEGVMKDEIKIENVIQKLSPTPAVCGIPKDRSYQLISEMEKHSRGWYSGYIGIRNATHADFAVALRCALINKLKCSLYTGVGVVLNSEGEKEWKELEHKMQQFLDFENSTSNDS